MWTAVRDMDIAAELIGIKLYQTKLMAFAVSSFDCGVSGALMVSCGSAPRVRELQHRDVIILFMVIIGGLGSLIGSFWRCIDLGLAGRPARGAARLGHSDQLGDRRDLQL